MNPEKRRAERRRIARGMARNPGERKAKFRRLEQAEADKALARERFDMPARPRLEKKEEPKKAGLLDRILGRSDAS